MLPVKSSKVQTVTWILYTIRDLQTLTIFSLDFGAAHCSRPLILEVHYWWLCLTLCCSCLERDTEALRKLNYANFIAPNLLVMSLIKLHCEYGVCLAGDCDSHRLLDWLLQPKHLDKHTEWCHPSNALLRVLGKVVFSRPWNYYWSEAKNKMILHLKWKSNQKKLQIEKEINISLILDILII